MQSDSRYKRHATQHRGITFRERANGSRSYYVYAGGRQIAVPGDLAAAKVKQGELRGRAARGEPVAPTKLTFGEVAEQWFESKERRLRPWTLKGYRATLDNVLLPRWGTWKLAQISTQHVAGLIRDLEAKGLAASYIDNLLKPLAGTFRFAMSRRLIGVDPVSLLTVDERPRRTSKKTFEWSPESVEALLSAARELGARPSRYDFSPILTFAIRTGMRLGEILGTRWQDVDLTSDSPSLNVVHQHNRLGELTAPKTANAVRRIPLGQSMVKFLLEQKMASAYSQDEDFVFASPSGEPLSHRVAQRGFDKAAERAGIQDVSFHAMRHAFASQIIAAGVSPVVLADLLGHSSSAITLNIYAHLFDRTRSDSAVRAAMEAAMGG